MASWVSTSAAVGMAIGPPLVYVDQAVSIVRKKRVLLRFRLTHVLLKLTRIFPQGFDRFFS